MENHRKKNETELQKKNPEGQSSRIEQKTESQNLNMKWQLKEKPKNS
jgi:hypothetical protein